MEEHPPFSSLYELLDYVIKHTSPGSKVFMGTTPTPIKPSCPACGWTLADIAHHARLGCGECYEHYKEELLPVILHAQKAVRHVGKHPKNKQESLEELRVRLAHAVKEERYEDASEIKKLIENYKN